MTDIESPFNEHFAPWGIRLPADALKQRKRWKIREAGGAVGDLFGADGSRLTP